MCTWDCSSEEISWQNLEGFCMLAATYAFSKWLQVWNGHKRIGPISYGDRHQKSTLQDLEQLESYWDRKSKYLRSFKIKKFNCIWTSHSKRYNDCQSYPNIKNRSKTSFFFLSVISVTFMGSSKIFGLNKLL